VRVLAKIYSTGSQKSSPLIIGILKEYISYFNGARLPQGITQPKLKQVAAQPSEPKAGRVIVFPVLNGLHHNYRRVAAYASVGQKSRRMKG
jgi:hypothetical protein